MASLPVNVAVLAAALLVSMAAALCGALAMKGALNQCHEQ